MCVLTQEEIKGVKINICNFFKNSKKFKEKNFKNRFFKIRKCLLKNKRRAFTKTYSSARREVKTMMFPYSKIVYKVWMKTGYEKWMVIIGVCDRYEVADKVSQAWRILHFNF